MGSSDQWPVPKDFRCKSRKVNKMLWLTGRVRKWQVEQTSGRRRRQTTAGEVLGRGKISRRRPKHQGKKHKKDLHKHHWTTQRWLRWGQHVPRELGLAFILCFSSAHWNHSSIIQSPSTKYRVHLRPNWSDPSEGSGGGEADGHTGHARARGRGSVVIRQREAEVRLQWITCPAVCELTRDQDDQCWEGAHRPRAASGQTARKGPNSATWLQSGSEADNTAAGQVTQCEVRQMVGLPCAVHLHLHAFSKSFTFDLNVKKQRHQVVAL